MRLLEITRSYFPSIGGLEQFVYNRTKVYKDIGIDYKIISTDFSTPKRSSNYSDENTIFIKQYTRYNITPSLNGYLDKSYDTISINQIGRFFSDYSIWKYKNTKTKIILTPHLSFHTKRFSGVKKIVNGIIIKFLFKKIDVLICFTEYEANFWMKNFGVKKEKIKIIPHYINIDESSSSSNEDKKFFLYIGNYEKNKRIDLLVEAFNELKQEEYSLFLTLNKSMIDKNLFEKIQINPKIKLLGHISDEEKDKLLNECSALILPSDYEAFGIVLLEASAHSKPILCSSLEVFKEILNEDGVILFQNRVDSIKNNLRGFMELTDQQKKNMGTINQMNVERFSYQKVFGLYKKLFEELV